MSQCSGEYIRLAYRSVNPRPLRDVSGDVVLVTGAGGYYSLATSKFSQIPLRVVMGSRVSRYRVGTTGNH